jgi:signal transduction histidine kinase
MDIEVDATPIPLRGRRLFLLLAQDVTERERIARRMRAQQATTRALAESSTLAEASPKIFHAICENLGCDWGELWRLDPVAQVMRCTQVWHPYDGRLPRMERATHRAVRARGEGIAGMVWARNRTIWIADLSQEHRFSELRVAASRGLRSAYAFPIRLKQEVLGVIAVFSRDAMPLDKHLLHLLKDICSQIGQVLGRRRAERELLEVAEREQQRIGQDLHDGLCQQLAGTAYIASHLEDKLAKKGHEEAVTAARIVELSQASAVQARQIARGLNPVQLGTNGLMAALKDLTSAVSLMLSVTCQFKCDHRVLVPDHDAAVHLYRITQEAIHNSITHGKATRIGVSLRRTHDGIALSVFDNGSGFTGVSADNWGMGLENMNYRAHTMGAELELHSRGGRGGTIMLCRLPLNGRPI